MSADAAGRPLDDAPGAELRRAIGTDEHGSPTGTGDPGRAGLLVVVLLRGVARTTYRSLRWLVRRAVTTWRRHRSRP